MTKKSKASIIGVREGGQKSAFWKGDSKMDENRTPNPEQQPNQPQGQPQNQAPQQPVQPQYQPYQQPPYHQGYTPYYVPQQQPANRGKGGGWIGFLRVMAWIMFAIYELLIVIGSIAIMAGGNFTINGSYTYLYGGTAIMVGILVLIIGSFFAFLMIAAINVYLDMAMNTARTATNTAKLAEKVEEIEKKIGK